MRKPVGLILILALTFFACNRVKKKGQEVAHEAKEKGTEIARSVKQKANEKYENAVDKVIPEFDAGTPDTRFNKLRFKELLQVELTPDVKNILCYGDQMGIDSKFQFSFNCAPSTVQRIIAQHKLTPDTLKMGELGLAREFDWWNNKKIEKLHAYSWSGEHQYYKYLWYDAAEAKAYYLDFDM